MSSQPDRPFHDPREELKTRFAAIVQGSEPPTAADRIVYRVAGGPPGKRLESMVQVTGTGKLSAAHMDELAGIPRREATAKLPSSEVSRLLGSVVGSGILDETATGGPFLPDSVIASISVETGRSSVTHHYLADERHRTSQGKELRGPLQTLHPVLDELWRRSTRGMTSSRRKG